ncbi:MAG: alpha/beta hydrolase [Gammaproteobacteria bacterium]|nr:alpha/beta hydrolase [Gammaproteobacteria bacterium]
MHEWTLTRSFNFHGDPVRYDVFGEGLPTVLMHGTPFWSYEWRRIARAIGSTHRVHVYDMLGYGQSAKRAGQDVSLGVQNRLFTALLEHWRLKDPAVIAHDFGGATALRTHLLDGRDYEKLLLVDPVAIRPWGSPFVQHVRQHEAAFAGVPHYLQEAIVRAYLRTAMHRRLFDRELAPYVAPWLGEDGQPALYRQIAQMDLKYTDEIEPLLGNIRCPVSILWGEEDTWIPVGQGRKLHQMIPGSTFRTIPGAGHLVQEDAPEAIVAEIINFFS